MSNTGYIYILSNQAMPSLYKIGMTCNQDITQRMSSLQNSGVPFPFDLEFAIKVENVEKVEKLLHEAFGEHRVNPKREFFQIPVKRIIAALKLTNGEEIKIDDSKVEEKSDDNCSLNEEKINYTKRKDITTFKMLEVPIGAELIFTKDASIKCTVIGNRCVDFRGEKFSLSGLAWKFLHDKYNWNGGVNGFWFFTYEGELLGERRQRLESENSDSEE